MSDVAIEIHNLVLKERKSCIKITQNTPQNGRMKTNYEIVICVKNISHKSQIHKNRHVLANPWMHNANKEKKRIMEKKGQ